MGLVEEVKELKEEVNKLNEEKAKVKPFKIPFFKRVKGKSAKKNYVTIIKVNENGHGEFIKEQI